MGVVIVVCPFVAKWRLINIPDNRSRYDLITAVTTDGTVPVTFALHLYLQKQVCSEENYLSENLCLHQSMSIKYFFHIAENGNGKIPSQIKYLFKILK